MHVLTLLHRLRFGCHSRIFVFLSCTHWSGCRRKRLHILLFFQFVVFFKLLTERKWLQRCDCGCTNQCLLGFISVHLHVQYFKMFITNQLALVLSPGILWDLFKWIFVVLPKIWGRHFIECSVEQMGCVQHMFETKLIKIADEEKILNFLHNLQDMCLFFFYDGKQL